jgi:hypothetical protein
MGRAWRTWSGDPGHVARPSPILADVGSDRSAVYFSADPAPNRLEVLGQRGNLLRKRVKLVPFSATAKSWDGFDIAHVGSLAEDAVYRVRIPGRPESWLALVPRGGQGDLELRKLARKPSPGGGILDDAKKAEEIAADIGRRHAVVLIPPGGLRRWQLCLTFLIETTELFFVEAAGKQQSLFGSRIGRRRIGDVELVDHEVYGWPVVGIEDVAQAVRPDPNHPG